MDEQELNEAEKESTETQPEPPQEAGTGTADEVSGANPDEPTQ